MLVKIKPKFFAIQTELSNTNYSFIGKLKSNCEIVGTISLNDIDFDCNEILETTDEDFAYRQGHGVEFVKRIRLQFLLEEKGFDFSKPIKIVIVEED